MGAGSQPATQAIAVEPQDQKGSVTLTRAPSPKSVDEPVTRKRKQVARRSKPFTKRVSVKEGSLPQGGSGSGVNFARNKRKMEGEGRSPCMWEEYLTTAKNAQWIAPVNFFPNAPFYETWQNLAKVGLVIELPNGTDPGDKEVPPYWFGKVMGFAGYKALVYYTPLPSENQDEPKPRPVSTWIPFCSLMPKPLGCSFIEHRILLPPKEMLATPPANWEPLAQATLKTILYPDEGPPPSSIPFSHNHTILQELKQRTARFKLGEVVEVLNKNDSGAYRLGKVAYVCGDRMFVEYLPQETDPSELGFWYGCHNAYVQKLGWCETIGARISKDVNPAKLYMPKWTPSRDIMVLPPIPPGLKITNQMIFETRHPVIPNKMCCGYVVKVLKHGYIMAGVDWTHEETLVEIVMHLSSDYIQPLGFCHANKIPLEYPGKAEDDVITTTVSTQFPPGFSWNKYLVKEAREALNPTGMHLQNPKPNPFSRGCKLEAVMIQSPAKIRPATVVKVAGRLIQIHFDGQSRQDQTAYQWVSCASSLIYPAGYAEMVGLEYKGRPDAPRRVDHLGK